MPVLGRTRSLEWQATTLASLPKEGGFRLAASAQPRALGGPRARVVEVKFLTWTDDKLLRPVVYEGLREDSRRLRCAARCRVRNQTFPAQPFAQCSVAVGIPPARIDS